MKRLLIIICSCLLYIGLCSAKTKIYLERKQKNAQTRSLVTAPTANHEGNTIYLQSDVSIKELQVTVKDEKGNIISSEFISLSSLQSYALSIGGAKEGIYIFLLKVSGHIRVGILRECWPKLQHILLLWSKVPPYRNLVLFWGRAV